MTERQDLIPKYEALFGSNGAEFGITAENNQITKIIETIPNLVGEQTASVCKTLRIEFQNGKAVELFRKHLAPAQNEQTQEEVILFVREANFFNVLLKDLNKIWMEKSGANEPLDFFPKCLHADDSEVIMENLIKGKGYHMNPKLDRQNLEFTMMSIKHLATFHGVSNVLLNEVGETAAMERYPCLKEIMISADNPMLVDMLENSKTVVLEMLNNSQIIGRENALKTLGKYGQNLKATLVNLVSSKPNQLIRAVGHGDCWNNNMLFLKDPITGELKHQALIDFQCTRIGSPNIDLAYFLFTSVQNAIRKTQWKNILQVYFNTFKNIIKRMGIKFPSEITFEEFLIDFKKYSLIGFWMGIFFSTGMEVMATIDSSNIEGDFTAYFNTATIKWIETNKEKAQEITKEIVEFCEEYENLLIN